METQTKKIIAYLIFPLFLLACAVVAANLQKPNDFLLRVSFLDVGQGDSTFIQTYEGNQIVIDGGPDDTILQRLSEQMPFWDRTIDLLILTHPDADHVGGTIDILKRYKVKKVLLTKVSAPTATYGEFTNLLEAEGAEKIYAHSGQRIWLDSATVFDIYYPSAGVEEDKSISTNNTSIVGKLTFGKTKILFTGDADSIVEDIVLSQFDLDSDILKVGHHGSKYSSSTEFIREVSPKFGVIQVGANNTYGHPTEEVLGILSSTNVEVLRTDIDQTIEFVSDGVNLYKK